jgi:hypothetical protein
MRYVNAIPKVIPTGLVLVHNHVAPDWPKGFRPNEADDSGRRHPDLPPGFEGFRAWLSKPDAKRLRVCQCGWAPSLARHFKLKDTSRIPGQQRSAS